MIKIWRSITSVCVETSPGRGRGSVETGQWQEFSSLDTTEISSGLTPLNLFDKDSVKKVKEAPGAGADNSRVDNDKEKHGKKTETAT